MSVEKHSFVVQQTLALKAEVSSMLSDANKGRNSLHRVPMSVALKVLARSLESSKGQSFDVRSFGALRDVERFISLYQDNKVVGDSLSFSDLLPVAHPFSTKSHAMTASALIHARLRWLVEEDEELLSLVASASLFEVDSAEFKYVASRVVAAGYGDVVLDSITAAAGSNTGGNSYWARRMRAMAQRRDRKGRFAYMGGGFRNLVRALNGAISWLTGRIVGISKDGSMVDVELSDGRIARMPISKGEAIKASLSKGESKTISPSVEEQEDVIDEKDIQFFDAPSGWDAWGDSSTAADGGKVDIFRDESGEYAVARKTNADGSREFSVLDLRGGGDGKEVGKAKSWAGVANVLKKNTSQEEKDSVKAQLIGEAKEPLSPEDIDDLFDAQESEQGDGELVTPTEAPAKPKLKSTGVPPRAYKLDLDNFEPEGRQSQDSTNFTDDPAELAKKFTSQQLALALRKAIVPLPGAKDNVYATGYGELPFNEGDEQVPAEALFEALKLQKIKAQEFVDKTYAKFAEEQGYDWSPEAEEEPKAEVKPVEPPAAPEDVEPTPPPAEPEPIKPSPTNPPPTKAGTKNGELSPDGQWKWYDGLDATMIMVDGKMVPKNPRRAPHWYPADGSPTEFPSDYGFSDDFEPAEPSLPDSVKTPEAPVEEPEVVPPPAEPEAPKTLETISPKSSKEMGSLAPGDVVDFGEMRDDKYPEGKFEVVDVYGEPTYTSGEEEVGIPTGWGNVEITLRPVDATAEKNAKDLGWMDDSLDTMTLDWNGNDNDGYYPDFNFYGSRGDLVDEGLIDPDYKPFVAEKESVPEAPEAPEALEAPAEVIPTEISATTENVEAIIEDAIALGGKLKFGYNEKVRVITPEELKTSKAGSKYVVGVDQNGDKKSFTIDKMVDSNDVLPPSVEDEVAVAEAIGDGEVSPSEVKQILDAENVDADEDASALEPKVIDIDASVPDVEQIVNDAIANGDFLRFSYNGKNRVIKPEEVKAGKNGNVNVIGVDDAGDTKAFTIQKMDKFEDAPVAEPIAEPVGKPRKVNTLVRDLQPGDVLASDFFVVESVFSDEESEKAKKGSVWVTGYYPGHESQKTKLWFPGDAREVYRDVEIPAKGDKPVLSKPKFKDFGKVKKDKATGEWSFVDPEHQVAFDKAMAEYNAKLEEAKASWSAPTDFVEIDLTKSDAPKVYKTISPASGLQAGDIAYNTEKPHPDTGVPAYEQYFVVEEVFTPSAEQIAESPELEGKVGVRGYFPGGKTQEKFWNPNTDITIIRGDTPPAKGDADDLHRPSLKKDAKYQNADGTKNVELYKEDAKKYHEAKAAASALYTPAKDIAEDYGASPAPVSKAPSKPGRAPSAPGFQGEYLDNLLRLAGGDVAKFRELLDNEIVTFFDLETTGQSKNFGADSRPIQVAAFRMNMKTGEIVDEFTAFMNPGEPLADFYYKVDENGNKVIDTSIKDENGNMISDEYLASLPTVEEQMAKFFEWLGTDSILAGQNSSGFDEPILRHIATNLGIDYGYKGLIDTLPIAQSVIEPGDKTVSRRLGDLAARYGMKLEGWHDARADTLVLHGILKGLLNEMQDGNIELDPDARLALFEEAMAEYDAKVKAYKDFKDAQNAAKIEKALKGEGDAPTLDELVKNASEGAPVPDPNGIFNDPKMVENPPGNLGESTPDGKNVAWVLDDANTTLIDETLRPNDFEVGDFFPTFDGSTFHEITDITENPEDANKLIITTKIVGTDKTYSKDYFRYNKSFSGVRRPNDKLDFVPSEPTEAVSDPVDAPAISPDVVPASTGEAADGLSTPIDISGWKKVGGQYGSNSGGVYEDANGNRFYVKQPTSEEHGRSEVLASALYDLAGVKVGRSYLGKDAEGNLVVVSPWVNDAKNNFGDVYNNPSIKKAVQADFAVDAWLMNWDAVGLNFDNMVTVGDDVFRIDAGGALMFRAQGAVKNPEFITPKVNEVDTMRTQGTAGKVFGDMTDEDVFESIKKLQEISPEQISEVVDKIYADDPALASQLKDLVIARRQDLLDRLVAPASQPSAVAPSVEEANEPEVPGEVDVPAADELFIYVDFSSPDALDVIKSSIGSKKMIAFNYNGSPRWLMVTGVTTGKNGNINVVGTTHLLETKAFTFQKMQDYTEPEIPSISPELPEVAGEKVSISEEAKNAIEDINKESSEQIAIGDPVISDDGGTATFAVSTPNGEYTVEMDIKTLKARVKQAGKPDVQFNNGIDAYAYIKQDIADSQYANSPEDGDVSLETPELGTELNSELASLMNDAVSPFNFYASYDVDADAIVISDLGGSGAKFTIFKDVNTGKFVAEYSGYPDPWDDGYIGSYDAINQAFPDIYSAIQQISNAESFNSGDNAEQSNDPVTNEINDIVETVMSGATDDVPSLDDIEESVKAEKNAAKLAAKDPSIVVQELKNDNLGYYKIPNGHLVVRSYVREIDGKIYKYEVVVARNSDETFTVYGIETDINSGAQRFVLFKGGNRRQSYKAIRNKIKELDNKINKVSTDSKSVFDKFEKLGYVNKSLKDFDFFSDDTVDADAPYTPPKSVSDVMASDVEYAKDVTIPKTGDMLKDSLINIVQNIADNQGLSSEVLQSLYDIPGIPDELVSDVIDIVNKAALKKAEVAPDGSDKPVVSNLPHVSANKKTAIKKGDRVLYVKNGKLRVGTVHDLVEAQLTVQKDGTYAYSDFTWVDFGMGKPMKRNAKYLQILTEDEYKKLKSGELPLPAPTYNPVYKGGEGDAGNLISKINPDDDGDGGDGGSGGVTPPNVPPTSPTSSPAETFNADLVTFKQTVSFTGSDGLVKDFDTSIAKSSNGTAQISINDSNGTTLFKKIINTPENYDIEDLFYKMSYQISTLGLDGGINFINSFDRDSSPAEKPSDAVDQIQPSEGMSGGIYFVPASDIENGTHVVDSLGVKILTNLDGVTNVVAQEPLVGRSASDLAVKDVVPFLDNYGDVQLGQVVKVDKGSMTSIVTIHYDKGSKQHKITYITVPAETKFKSFRPSKPLEDYVPSKKIDSKSGSASVQDVATLINNITSKPAVSQIINTQSVTEAVASTVSQAEGGSTPDAPEGVPVSMSDVNIDDYSILPMVWNNIEIGDIIRHGYSMNPDTGKSEHNFFAVTSVDSYGTDGLEVSFTNLRTGEKSSLKLSKYDKSTVVSGDRAVFRHKSEIKNNPYEFSVAPVDFADGTKKSKFENIKAINRKNIKVGDLIPFRTGSYRYYVQVVGVHPVTSRNGSYETTEYYYTYRRINQDPNSSGHHKLYVGKLNQGVYKNVKRPTEKFVSSNVTKIEKPKKESPKNALTVSADGVSLFNTVEDLANAGSYDKKTSDFTDEFGADDYDQFKEAYKAKKLMVKDGNSSPKYLVPGLVASDDNDDSPSAGIVTKLLPDSSDSNSSQVEITFMTGPRAGTSAVVPAKSLRATKHKFTQDGAKKLGVQLDEDFYKQISDEVAEIKARIAKAKAEKEALEKAKKEAEKAAKENFEKNFPVGSGTDTIVVHEPQDWATSNFEGVKSLTGALSEVSSNPVNAREGVSVPVDSDSIEDISLKVQRVKASDGSMKTRVTFKLTEWSAKLKVKELIDNLPEGAQDIDAAEVTRYVIENYGENPTDLMVESGTFQTGSVGSDSSGVYIAGKDKGRTFIVPIKNAKGEVIGHFKLIRANKTTSEIDFDKQGASQSGNPRAFHNTVELMLNDGVSADDVQDALSAVGVSQARPATKADVRMVAENKLLSIFAPKPADGTRNYAGEERVKALQFIKDTYNITADDVSIESMASGNDFQFLLSREKGVELAKKNKIQGFYHSLHGSSGNAKKIASRIRQRGLKGTYERWMNGWNTAGMSSAADISLAGGGSVFMHMRKGEYDESNSWADNLGSGVVAFDAAEMLRRLDYFSNQGDGYGAKPTGEIAFEKFKNAQHETMFKGIAYWAEALKISLGKMTAEEVYQLFVQAGITEIDGVSLKELLGL